MGRAAEARVELVEVALAGGEFVGKEIGESHDLRGRVLREGIGDRSAAVSAAQQAVAHGGVGCIAEGGERLEQSEAGCGGAPVWMSSRRSIVSLFL